MLAKHRRKFGLALKVAIVLLAAGYIVWRLAWKFDFHDFSLDKITHCIINHPYVFLLVILLMPLNWLLEAYKWKCIARTKITISFAQAMHSVLAGVTIGTATPNRVGEFAGRIFMLEEGDRFELLQLSFISSFCQVAVTVVFGILGFVFVGFSPDLFGADLTFYLLIGAGIMVCCVPLFLKFFPQGWKKKIAVVLDFPGKKMAWALFISAARYLVYVCQFLLLLFCFFPFYGDFFHLRTNFSLVCISYFIITIIPTFSFTEVFIRGTVAGTIFLAYDTNTFPGVFDAAILLWTINVAIPSLIGTVYVFRLKFTRKE